MQKLLFFSFLFAFSLNTQARTFLSYRQFQKLAPLQKQMYIEALQNLAVDLSQNPQLVSEAQLRIPTRWSALVFSQIAYAAMTEAECTVTSAKDFSNEQLVEKINGVSHCISEIKATLDETRKAPYFNSTPKTLVVLAEEYAERMKAGKLNMKDRRTRESRNILASAMKEVEKNHTQNRNEFPEFKKAYSDLGVNPTTLNTSLPGAVDPVKSPPATRTIYSENDPYCLHSGFVIPKGKGCQPLKKLPDSYKGYFDPENFSCADEKENLCNPLLFGYVEECKSNESRPCATKKPVCVPSSKTATLKCKEKSTELKTIPSITAILRSQHGEKLYKELTSSLTNLCDSSNLEKRKLRESLKKDIEETCKVAFQTFNERVNQGPPKPRTDGEAPKAGTK